MWKGSIETDNGVTIVKNLASPQFRRDVVEFQEDFIIRGSDPNANYLFVNPWNLLLDEKKNLYVLDSRDGNIKVFDEYGHFLRIIGRQGAGPGELDGPVFMDMIHKEIAVYCARNRHLVFFDLEGKYARTLYGAARMVMMKFDSKGNIFGICLVNRDGQNKYELQKFDPSMKYLKTFASRNWTKPNYFKSEATFTITKEDLIVYADPETYELKIFDNDGKLVRKIRKEYNPVRIPQEEIETVTKLPKFEGEVLPKYYMPYYFLNIDEEGRIIVNTYCKLVGNKEWACDIFSPEGKFLTTISLRYYTGCLWANSRLYAVEEDEDGLPIVKVYRVIWKI